MTIVGLYNRVKAVDTDKVINDAFQNSKSDLEDINRERMNDGVRADGSIMPNYSYISQKVYGYPNSPIKLLATGAFQRAIKVEVNAAIVKTDSTDEKSPMLKARYGEEIFGTGGDYKKQFLDESLRPNFNKEISAATGLKFGK